MIPQNVKGVTDKIIKSKGDDLRYILSYLLRTNLICTPFCHWGYMVDNSPMCWIYTDDHFIPHDIITAMTKCKNNKHCMWKAPVDENRIIFPNSLLLMEGLEI